MRKLVVIALLAGCSLLAGACMSEDEDSVKLTGTVVYLTIEGSFYGIRGDDGKNYDPVNLPEEFRSDGLRVRFEARELKGQGSVHMWGVLIEIISIQKL